MSEPNRFITYRLCDNDFSQHMKRAAEFMNWFYGDELKTVTADAFRAAIAYHMAGEAMMRAVMRGDLDRHERTVQWYFEYFNKAKVEFGREAADADGDSGYVSIDTATGYVWTH